MMSHIPSHRIQPLFGSIGEIMPGIAVGMYIHQSRQYTAPLQRDDLLICRSPGAVTGRSPGRILQDLLYPVSAHAQAPLYKTILPLKYECVCEYHISHHPVTVHRSAGAASSLYTQLKTSTLPDVSIRIPKSPGTCNIPHIPGHFPFSDSGTFFRPPASDCGAVVSLPIPDHRTSTSSIRKFSSLPAIS